jgi:hypothetical protein
VVLYIDTDDFDQAFSFSNSLIEPNSDSTVVDQYRTSERGDSRAIATLWPIGRKCAPADSPPILPPAISTNAYADDGQSSDFEASAAVPAHVVGNAIAADRRGRAIIKVMRKAFRTRERNPPPHAPSLPAAPLKRAARARAVHSHKPTEALERPATMGMAATESHQAGRNPTMTFGQVVKPTPSPSVAGSSIPYPSHAPTTSS